MDRIQELERSNALSQACIQELGVEYATLHNDWLTLHRNLGTYLEDAGRTQREAQVAIDKAYTRLQGMRCAVQSSEEVIEHYCT